MRVQYIIFNYFWSKKIKNIKYKNFSGANFHFLHLIAWASFRNFTAWTSSRF